MRIATKRFISYKWLSRKVCERASWRNLPDKWLKERFKHLRYDSNSNDLGLGSVRIFLDKSRDSKLTSFPNDLGISPQNVLRAKEKSNMFWRFSMKLGLSPDSWLPDRSTTVTAIIFPTLRERLPRRKFVDILNIIMLFRLYNELGIVPVNRLEPK